MKIYEIIIEKMNYDTNKTELYKHYEISNNKKSLIDDMEAKGIEPSEIIAVNEKKSAFNAEDVIPYILESGMRDEHKTILIEILKHEQII